MEEFRKTIQNGTHVIYFGASWCKNCKAVKEKLEQQTQPNILIYDVNENEDEAAICAVTKLPTIQVWKNGTMEIKYEGARECNIELFIYKKFTEDYVQNVDTEEDF